jgi:hypothetical protein
VGLREAKREKDKPRAGVANVLAIIRSGAVGFIDWLDDLESHPTGK